MSTSKSSPKSLQALAHFFGKARPISGPGPCARISMPLETLKLKTSSRHQDLKGRCVDCRRRLWTRSWKEKLRSTFCRNSKKRPDLYVGKCVVEQRCADCSMPLRCAECSEGFFRNLSEEEMRVFVKAVVLFAMKGLCNDCNDDFKDLYEDLFEGTPCEDVHAMPETQFQQPIKIHNGPARAQQEKVSEIEPYCECPAAGCPGGILRKKGAEPYYEYADSKNNHSLGQYFDYPGRKNKPKQDMEIAELEWNGGVYLGDWKREISDLLCDRFQLVLER